MREHGVQVHKPPVVYRYIDWSTAAPLQSEFSMYEGSRETSRPMMLLRRLCDTVAMLASDHAGEVGRLPWGKLRYTYVKWVLCLLESTTCSCGSIGAQVHKSPLVYRYIEWSTTVPLQMIEASSS